MRIRPLAAALLCLVAPATARAHFKLVYPPPWINEGRLGDPQKDTPCGGDRGTPSGIVTAFRPGQKITVRWEETIYHPGHWRIAFAADRNQLIDPTVTVDANQNAAGATITDPPVAPVLLDNLYPRTGGGDTQVFEQEVTLPNMECERCTLQVIQFMLGHGPPNYIYFHCADIKLSNDAPPPDMSGMSSGGCTATRSGLDQGAWLLMLALLLRFGRSARARR